MISILGMILIAVPIVLIAIFLLRRRHPPVPGARPFTLIATRFIAIAYAALLLVLTVTNVVSTLASDAVGVRMPVRQFWPEAHPWITIDQGPTASVTGGGFTLADVTVADLGTDARLLLAAGHALQGLTFLVIAITVALLCYRLLNGMAFKPTLSRSISVTAVAIAVGGVLWQVAFWIGGSLASAQVLTVTGWRSEGPPLDDPLVDEFDPFAIGLPEPSFALTIDFWPLFLGLALAAVAAAFRYGERLQRDTEGLV